MVPLKLAVAWVARVVAWVLIAYGVVLVAGSMLILCGYDGTDVNPSVPLVAGAGLATVGWYVNCRAVGAIRHRRPEARGFDVIGPTRPIGQK
jgi:hypothetical protein